MIIIKLNAGLGNQMYQYASGRALALRLNQKVILDTAWYNRDGVYRGRDILNFSIQAIEKVDYAYKLQKKRYGLYWFNKLLSKRIHVLEDPVWDINENFFTVNDDHIVLEGYWASYKYFDNVRDILLKDFALKGELNEQLSLWYKHIEGQNSVAVHIRRGDYLKAKESQLFNNQKIDYYLNAVRFMIEKIPNPFFYIFSDDIQWVSENWLENFKKEADNIFVVASRSSPNLDLKKMSLCNHQIIANSTYSWWAAWLNENQDKVVIYPKVWYSKPEWQQSFENNSFIPDGWLGVI